MNAGRLYLIKSESSRVSQFPERRGLNGPVQRAVSTPVSWRLTMSTAIGCYTACKSLHTAHDFASHNTICPIIRERSARRLELSPIAANQKVRKHLGQPVVMQFDWN